MCWEMVPGHKPLDRTRAMGVPRVQGGRGGEQPRPRRAGKTHSRASSLVGDPDKKLRFHKKYPVKADLKFYGSHRLSLFNYINNLIKAISRSH